MMNPKNSIITEELAVELSDIADAIERSKYILDFKDEEEETIQTYDVATWKRATNFLIQYSKKILELTGKVISTPKIFDGSNGSIDLLWENERFRLLMNFPKAENKPATFFGDDYMEQFVKGTFFLGRFNHVA